MKKILLSAIAAFGMLGIQAQSPVFDYSFEQTLTSSGSGPTLTHSANNPTYSDNAKSGNGVYSLYLNGSEYLNAAFPPANALTGFTVNFWTIIGSKPNYNVALCQLKHVQTSDGSFYPGSFLVGTNSKRPYFEVYVSETEADYFTAGDTLDNNWHMLTFKWEPDTMLIYVDGAFVYGDIGPSTFLSSNLPLTIGALQNDLQGVLGYQSSFEGSIDEVRIYQTGLSDASILSLYNTGEIISGINSVENEIKVGMYPNPANTILNIKTTENIVNASVYNALGSLVHQEAGNIESVDVSDLNQGVYLLHLTAKNGKKVVKKFTKE